MDHHVDRFWFLYINYKRESCKFVCLLFNNLDMHENQHVLRFTETTEMHNRNIVH